MQSLLRIKNIRGINKNMYSAFYELADHIAYSLTKNILLFKEAPLYLSIF